MANQPKHKAPEGMEPYDLEGKSDLGALSTEQQEKLNQFKIKTRVENEKYLRDHPEVECILAGFLGEALIKRPEDIREFAAEYFTSVDLPGKVQKQLEDRQAVLKQNRILQKI
ncbi:RIIa domain-containing protein 1-like [Pomacea canaliculata]|uniref:RIIa domain-containing protein 1-like n=1 Tax=Pomacea canaliculata TaxID=400727 RepID=UPI000D73247C|nr:RIIa domain-containing protein 1-like [Pomacea canaliculata]